MWNIQAGCSERFLLGLRQCRPPDTGSSVCLLSLPMPRCKELRLDWWWQPNVPQPCERSGAGLLIHLCPSFLLVGRAPFRSVLWALLADSESRFFRQRTCSCRRGTLMASDKSPPFPRRRRCPCLSTVSAIEPQFKQRHASPSSPIAEMSASGSDDKR